MGQEQEKANDWENPEMVGHNKELPHCTLIPYWAERLGKNKLHAYQLSKRSGELFCENLDDRVRISGHAVLYAKGEVCL